MTDRRYFWDGDTWRGAQGTPSDYVPIAGKTTPLHCPHYSDRRFAQGKTHTLYGRQEPGLHYVYSDRIWQWDYAKAGRASEQATAAHGNTHTPQWYETYLTAYFGIPVDLVHIIGGVNVSSGYEYYAFGYREGSRWSPPAASPGSGSTDSSVGGER